MKKEVDAALSGFLQKGQKSLVKKACLLLPSGVHFLAQKKGDWDFDEPWASLCLSPHQHNLFDEGSFTFILLFLQQFLIPFAASKKSSICFDLSIRRILLHRSGIKRLPCVFVQGAEAPKNEGHFSKTTFILFCLLCRGLYDHLSSFPTGAAAFFILH